jgi:hypothetical protein
MRQEQSRVAGALLFDSADLAPIVGRKARRARTYQAVMNVSVRRMRYALLQRNVIQSSHNFLLDNTLRSPRSLRCEKCGLAIPRTTWETLERSPWARVLRDDSPAAPV